MDPLDRLAAKLAALNSEVRTKQEIREALEEFVRMGLLTYDERTGEFTRIATSEEARRKLAERG